MSLYFSSAGYDVEGQWWQKHCYNMGVWPRGSNSWKKHHHPFCELWLAEFFTLGKIWNELHKAAAVGIASILTWPNCMEKADWWLGKTGKQLLNSVWCCLIICWTCCLEYLLGSRCAKWDMRAKGNISCCVVQGQQRSQRQFSLLLKS